MYFVYKDFCLLIEARYCPLYQHLFKTKRNNYKYCINSCKIVGIRDQGFFSLFLHEILYVFTNLIHTKIQMNYILKSTKHVQTFLRLL